MTPPKETAREKNADPAKDFHAHLDKCDRCRNQPFNLCPIGAILIQHGISTLARLPLIGRAI